MIGPKKIESVDRACREIFQQCVYFRLVRVTLQYLPVDVIDVTETLKSERAAEYMTIRTIEVSGKSQCNIDQR